MKRTEATYTNRIATLMFLAAIIGFAGIANAETANSHKGSLVIKTQTVVQGTLLPPGNYDVREVRTPQGPSVEFVRKYWNELASEMVQAEEDQLVSRVPVVERLLSAPPTHTRLQLLPDGSGASALEIRGAAVDYVFTHPDGANHTVASTNCSTNGN